MIRLPVLLNGDYKQVVGSIILHGELEEIYTKTNHLVLNPKVIRKADGTQEVVAFCVYPMPFEPEPVKKRRKRRGESEGDPD
jgi:hypothetical protein